MTMREAIMELLQRDYVTFAELSRIPGFEGEFALHAPNYPNIIYWSHVSREAADAIEELRREKFFEFRPASPMSYLIDGVSLDLPLAKRRYHYKTLHWLPVTLCIPHHVEKYHP